ncbi:MAG: hypothetical protein FDW93_00300 [Bergeyella sp.]|nr:hypothetical protein [Bergeyella sp.]
MGVNTNNPTSTLDVNGGVRVRKIDTFKNKPSFVLVPDSKGVISKISVTSLESKTEVDKVKSRVIAVVQKGKDQLIREKNTYVDYVFEGNISGINTDGIKFNSDKTEIILPADKAFKIKGFLGIRGRKPESSSTGTPGYITCDFYTKEENKTNIIITTMGYTESSTEKFDDGGQTRPIVILITGKEGGSIRLRARYGGRDAGDSGYYIAGRPLATSLGSYLLIEEL